MLGRDCGIVLSDYNDNGWGTPSVDIVAAAETHVHLPYAFHFRSPRAIF